MPASSALRCCFVNTFSDFIASFLFPNNSSTIRYAPSLPWLARSVLRHVHRYYVCVLRLPAFIRQTFVSFCLPYHALPILFVSSYHHRNRGCNKTGLFRVSPRSTINPFSRMEKRGPPRFLGCPSYTYA